MDQVAALPFRILPGVANLAGEAVDILLITSRDTGRWVLPKGNIEAGESAAAAAAREAAEEAGSMGALACQPIGTYRYAKRTANGPADERAVAVFPLRVRELALDWPERKQRERRWFSRAEAAAAVEEDELRVLIAKFAG
jgi:8-oxo-dGTP pyrophosphatase MutT (NUDIX family)